MGPKVNITLAILAISTIEVMALLMGINGKGLALSIGGITTLIGWELRVYYDYRKKHED